MNAISGNVALKEVKATVSKMKNRMQAATPKAEMTAVAKVVKKTAVQVTAVNLDAEFECIKLHAKQAMIGRINSRKQFNKAFVELMLFFDRAMYAPSYLDKFYETDGKAHKRKVNHGHNFAPLIAEVWDGLEGKKLDTNKKNRWSRAMNNLLKIYKSDPKYQTDTVNRLAELLDTKGLASFVKYGADEQKTDDDVADYVADVQLVNKNLTILSRGETKKLYAIGAKHFGTAKLVPHAKFSMSIPVNNDSMSLVLLRDMGNNEYAVITATAEEETMHEYVTQKYVSDFTVAPKAMRVIYETIATQCPPNQLKHIYHKLVDKAGTFADGHEKNVVRRLFYKHETGQFIMSPVRADSGVVTVLNPKIQVLKNVQGDVLLSTMSRRKLEEKIISPRLFNTHVAKNLDQNDLIEESKNFSNQVTLVIPDQEEKIEVIFGPELSKKESFSQVVVKRWSEKKANWSVELPVEWIKKFENSFTSNWLASHGQHAVRAHQKMLELEFGTKSIKVNFFEKENEFDLSNEVQFKVDSVKGKAQKMRVFSKDFAIAMHALSCIPLIGQVRIFLINDVIALKYETEVGDYELYIPGCEENGIRKSKGFDKYQLSIYEPDAMELAEEQSEEESAEVL